MKELCIAGNCSSSVILKYHRPFKAVKNAIEMQASLVIDMIKYLNHPFFHLCVNNIGKNYFKPKPKWKFWYEIESTLCKRGTRWHAGNNLHRESVRSSSGYSFLCRDKSDKRGALQFPERVNLSSLSTENTFIKVNGIIFRIYRQSYIITEVTIWIDISINDSIPCKWLNNTIPVCKYYLLIDNKWLYHSSSHL